MGNGDGDARRQVNAHSLPVRGHGVKGSRNHKETNHTTHFLTLEVGVCSPESTYASLICMAAISLPVATAVWIAKK